MESLASKSLLQQPHGNAGELRFVMLETIREYALEQLALSDEWAAIRRQHATVFRALAETAISLRFASALRLFWFMRGYLTEGRERLARILALGAISKRDHAQALDCAGFLARYQGDYTTATRLINESLAIWRTPGHTQGVADSLSNLGYVMLHQGNYPTARVLYE